VVKLQGLGFSPPFRDRPGLPLLEIARKVGGVGVIGHDADTGKYGGEMRGKRS
jgi:hypothetical protein